jgi:predicted N-acetyltransferase YhbS
MTHMLEAAETRADGALMMIGDPEYYGRFFGFTADATGAWDLPGPFERRRLLARAVNGHALPVNAGMIGPR